MERKVCVVTGARAEYGLLRWTMEEVRSRASMRLQVVATGMHLSPRFGHTYREIERDGFTIDEKIEMLVEGDTTTSVTKSMGIGLIGFADAFARLRPDIVVLLGDRYEILAAATAALVARIPIAHAHGGEATEGAIDEAIRHSITKMSQVHFVAAEPYRRRVIQLGEAPERVFLVGGLGLDNIERLKLLGRAELEASLGFSLGKRNLLVTFHPVTLEPATSARQMAELLSVLDELSDTHIVFTMPNADPDAATIFELIEQFCRTHPNARAYTSLGQVRYLSCVRQVDVVVGNSSSGLTEVPSFHKPTVNIGDRQRGRLKADSVIDCPPDGPSIAAAIREAYSDGFQSTLARVRNPYGTPGASWRIADVLEHINLDGILKKRFQDLPATENPGDGFTSAEHARSAPASRRS